MGKRTEIVSFLILGFCFFFDKVDVPSVIKAILSASFLFTAAIIWTCDYYTIALKNEKKKGKNNQALWYPLVIGILMLTITGITAAIELRPFLEPLLGPQPEEGSYYLVFSFSLLLPIVMTIFLVIYVRFSYLKKATL